jgi:hypothetical protein
MGIVNWREVAEGREGLRKASGEALISLGQWSHRSRRIRSDWECGLPVIIILTFREMPYLPLRVFLDLQSSETAHNKLLERVFTNFHNLRVTFDDTGMVKADIFHNTTYSV